MSKETKEASSEFSRCDYCTGFEQKIDSVEDPISQKIGEEEREKILQQIKELINNEDSDCEEVFNQIKYQITSYVLKHEFNLHHNLSVQLTLWLERCQSPHSFENLQNVIDTYLKPNVLGENHNKS